MISGTTVVNRRKRSKDNQNLNRIAESDAQLYRDLAQASGGLVVEVSKTELPEATSIITQFSRSSLVTSLCSLPYSDSSVERFQLCHLFNVDLPGNPAAGGQEPGTDRYLFFYG